MEHVTAASSRAAKVRSIGLSREHDRRLRDLIEAALLRYPNHKKDDHQVVAYYDDLRRVAQQEGIGRVEAAMREAWTRCKFLPEAPEVRDFLPAPENFGPRRWCDVNCKTCNGSGWFLLNGFARRCECHTLKRPPASVEAAADGKSARVGGS